MKKLFAALLLLPALALAQTNAPALISQRGTTLPAACTLGQLFFKTDATAGQNVYECASTNTWTQETGGGTGTVTSVSVTTANGVSGSVATATTTPAITLTLGAITPTTVDKVTITAPATGSTLTIADGKTFTVSNTLTLTGTDSSSLNIQTGGTLSTLAATPGVGDIAYFSIGGSSPALSLITAAAVGKIYASAGVTTAPALTATPQLGASGTLGTLAFGNATSGTITLSPVSGALGSVTLSMPAATDTLVGKATTDTLTNKTLTTPTITSPTVTGSAVTLTSGTSRTLANASEIVVCTSTCTVTPPGAATAGQQFCVQNDDNVATVITLAAVSGVQYEVTARTSYKSANTALASSGAVANQICMVAISGTKWNVFSYTGTWS